MGSGLARARVLGTVYMLPIACRYEGETTTVRVQMIESNMILKAARKPVSAGMFWRHLLVACTMLAAGYAGETGALEAWIGFILGMPDGSLASRRYSS